LAYATLGRQHATSQNYYAMKILATHVKTIK